MPSTPDPSCVFCALQGGAGDQISIVAESDLAVAFLDAYPVAEGHTLAVPRQHVLAMTELTSEEGGALWDLTQKVAVRVRETFAPAINRNCSAPGVAWG